MMQNNENVVKTGSGSGDNTVGQRSTGNAGQNGNPDSNKRAQTISELQLGGLDKRGFRVTDVFWATNDYVVYKAGGRVSPMFNDDDSIAKEQRLRYMKLGQSLARINSLEPGRVISRHNPLKSWFMEKMQIRNATDSGTGWEEDTVKEGSRDYFSREVARSIALCLDNLGKDAQKLLNTLEKKITNLKQNEYRMYYLIACFILMIVYVGLVICFTYEIIIPKEGALRQLVLFADKNSILMRSTALGALAGFFSVSIGIQSLNFDLDARKYLIVSYGFTRLFVAIIASLFIYCAIRSGFVFANFDTDSITCLPRNNAILYVFAFLSGFSEHFVPNVLKNIEHGQNYIGTKVPKKSEENNDDD